MAHYRYHRREGAPCRDVSWHPHQPVLASTSFDRTVKVWTVNHKKSNELEVNREDEVELSQNEDVESEGDVDMEEEEEESSSHQTQTVTMQELLQILFRRG